VGILEITQITFLKIKLLTGLNVLNMIDFILGVFASVTASALLLSVKPIRLFFKSLFFPIKGYKSLGIIELFGSRSKAFNKLYNDVIDEIMVLNFKGYSIFDSANFVESNLYKLIHEKRVHTIKLLLLNPESDRYISDRKNELGESKSGTIKEDFANDIYFNVQKLKQICSKKETKSDVLCRYFSEELKWSLIFSKNYILVSFYPIKDIAPNSPALLVKRNSSFLGYSFEKYFNDIWENHSKNAFIEKEKTNNNVIIIAGGSFQGKSLVSLSLANKYQYSGVLTTDMIRNFLKIENPEEECYSTSTYKLNPEELKTQVEGVSKILEKQLEIYENRGEKIIIEGMHFSERFIDQISKKKYLKIFLNNNRDIKERVLLKQKTRHKFSVESEIEYVQNFNLEFEHTAYYKNENRINEIHKKLSDVCIKNGFIEVKFNDLDEAIQKCEKLVEDFLM